MAVVVAASFSYHELKFFSSAALLLKCSLTVLLLPSSALCAALKFSVVFPLALVGSFLLSKWD